MNKKMKLIYDKKTHDSIPFFPKSSNHKNSSLLTISSVFSLFFFMVLQFEIKDKKKLFLFVNPFNNNSNVSSNSEWKKIVVTNVTKLSQKISNISSNVKIFFFIKLHRK